jgi:hypothetical protein
VGFGGGGPLSVFKRVLCVGFCGWLKAGPKVHGGLELQFGVRCCYLVYKGTLPLLSIIKVI